MHDDDESLNPGVEIQDTYVFDCRETPGDLIELFRVGPPGNDLSVIALDTAVGEHSFMEDEDGNTRSTVILNPEDARQLAVTLIELADECEGAFTSFFNDDPFGGDNDD